MILMQINFINEVEPAFDDFEPFLKRILEKTLNLTQDDNKVSVNIVLIDDVTMKNYNNSYRNIDKTTDVLSFVDGDMMGDLKHLGDLLISYEAVYRQAKDYEHSLKREFCFLVTHGYLHLLGYDHNTKEEEKEMFSLQKDILDGIAKKNN